MFKIINLYYVARKYYLSFQSFSKRETQSRLLWFYVSAYSSLFLPSHFLVYLPTLYICPLFFTSSPFPNPILPTLQTPISTHFHSQYLSISSSILFFQS